MKTTIFFLAVTLILFVQSCNFSSEQNGMNGYKMYVANPSNLKFNPGEVIRINFVLENYSDDTLAASFMVETPDGFALVHDSNNSIVTNEEDPCSHTRCGDFILHAKPHSKCEGSALIKAADSLTTGCKARLGIVALSNIDTLAFNFSRKVTVK